MNIDWETAPEWAIGHGLIDSGCIKQVWFGEKAYMILGDSRSYVFGGGVGETRHNHTLSQIQFQQLRPVAWSGEGLPPAGTVCEWHPNHDGWVQVEILGHNGEETWYRQAGSTLSDTCLRMAFFRPIRTAEQIIADLEREERIKVVTAWIEGIAQEYGPDAAAKCEAIISEAEDRKQVTK
ncbi:hypothetical protein [Pseudomonas gregormendelii]